MGLNKKAIFFSTDALIALAIVIMGALIIYPLIGTDTNRHYAQSDLLESLSSISVGEINNSYMTTLITSGQVTNMNKTLLEQLAELYVINKTLAEELGNSILTDIQTTENIGIWFGGKMVATKNNTPIDNAREIIIEEQTITGIQEGSAVTAFSGRAYLQNSLRNKYFYFGGYVGEGNLSANIEYEGNISNAKMELAITRNFTLYINGNYEGEYEGSGSQTTPKTYTLPITNFSSGNNTVELRGAYLGLAGGFIKVGYDPGVTYEQEEKKYLPGIKGVINLYDGFYVPGTLNTLNIFLKFNNTVETYLNIGNTTVYNDSTTGIETVTLNNTYLSGILNYNHLSNSTTPIRFGIENLTGLPGLGLEADIFSITSTSGGMSSNVAGGGTPKKMDVAIEANKDFVFRVLNYLESRVGVVGYDTDAPDPEYHNLTTNLTALNNTIDEWKAGGSQCACCGINKAVHALANYSNSSRFRSMVIMSDGAANTVCAEQGTGSAEGDAIKAACDAYSNYSIRIYTIGFGNDANESSLIEMAECGQGSYYSTVDNLLSVYQQIANDLLETVFEEQALNYSSGSPSYLYPESYIRYGYDKGTTPFGLITTTEKQFDNENGGTFTPPLNSTILEAVVVSYSGTRWTDSISINNNTIYNLSDFKTKYLALGDPYSINIPTNYVNNNTNIVNITTAREQGNTTGGSPYNKIIYTILQKDATAYSAISLTAKGCRWIIEFQDGNNITTNIPNDYTETEYCYYTSTAQNISNNNDATQTSVRNLFQLLDHDNDGKIDVTFTDQDLQITSSQISGIPFDWSTKIQVRSWK